MARLALLNNRGTTLIELVIAIVVAGVVLSAMLLTYGNMMARSVDPMVEQQSLLAAKALMEEIIAKPYLDPADKTLCPAKPASRTVFDNVCDYDGYSVTGVSDNAGQTYAKLSQYTLSVSITRAAWGGLTANCNMQVQVTSSNPLGRPVLLTAYRTCYEFQECNAYCN